ncbi:MAG: 16S rRNA (cytidine(1402)-2'-O)-methyltransferase [Acidimicrobiia bacterium]|nr:16S rRNA (cytidine(1402)-2'-O)-methyltransferase [Acidimicrobiia bacterium]MBV9043145.1 16S rRNA (cytidine(1402)-2'-O)-methyltransferase [Acidimicrobiia bacterium]
MGGALVIVATPIGNLADLSPRAVDALAAADAIACEDTRRTRKLLTHAGIKSPALITVNDHSEARQVRGVLGRLERGERVAVVTDAGTPGISDPGERLVAAATAAGYDVEVVPGASAAIAALVVSGLPTGRFTFEGFLPRKGSGRAERVEALRGEQRTTILYEAPHRVRQTVAELAEALGPLRRVTIVRELTKLHEEVWRGTLGGAVDHLAERDPRGEYVLVLGGAAPPAKPSTDEVTDALRARLAAGDDKKTATAAVAKELRVPKRTVYEIATRL